jgi:predicted nucleic acid-binding protein
MLVYLDATICIYFVEGDQSYKARAAARLARLIADGDKTTVSDLN